MKKRLGLVFVVILSSLALMHCSTAERAPFDPAECNQQGGYERGFIEGKNGRNPDSNYVERCRDDLRAAVRTGYQQGFEKGHAEYLKWMDGQQVAANEPPKPQYLCEITHQKRGFQAMADSMDEARRKVIDQCIQFMAKTLCQPLVSCKQVSSALVNDRAYHCKLTAMSDSFDAFAATKAEAEAANRTACQAKQKDAFFCQSMQSCQANQ